MLFISAELIKDVSSNLFPQYILGRYTESIDDLRALHDKNKWKIMKKQQMYAEFRDKLNVSTIQFVSCDDISFCLLLILKILIHFLPNHTMDCIYGLYLINATFDLKSYEISHCYNFDLYKIQVLIAVFKYYVRNA